MQIENLRDLKKLIQLCRLTGVEAIEIGDIKMNLGPTPTIIRSTKLKSEPNQTFTTPYAPGGITAEIQIPTDGITEEQMLFWSAQGTENQ